MRPLGDELEHAPSGHEIWAELGATGDPDDVAGHVPALAAAGARRVAFFPLADLDVARGQLRTLVDTIFGR